jgi:hypothetical protein
LATLIDVAHTSSLLVSLLLGLMMIIAAGALTNTYVECDQKLLIYMFIQGGAHILFGVSSYDTIRSFLYSIFLEPEEPGKCAHSV